MRDSAQRVHIVSYVCEDCDAQLSCAAGLSTDGICVRCGSPMRIEDLFSDRRIVTMPVTTDRRALAA